jgi:hypothetical protein
MEGRGSEVQRTAIQHLISLKITHHCTEYCILSSTSVLYLSSQLLWIRLPPTQTLTYRLSLCSLLSPLSYSLLFSSLCLDIPTERRHRGEEEDEEEAEENEGEG